MIEKNYCVYCHILRSDGRRYIGITGQNPRKRWSYGAGYEARTHIGAAIRKYGWKSFEHVILESGLTEEEAKKREIELIAFYDTTNPEKGFNLTSGGEGVLHLKVTPETIEKLRKSHTGKKQSAETIRKRNESRAEYYKTHPYREVPREHIMKMIEARKGLPLHNKGVPLSEEAKENLRQKNLGKKHSEETRAKMRLHAAKNKKVKMFDMNGNYIRSFQSAQEAMRTIGAASSSSIASCARGEMKSAYNYKWEYYE